MLKKIARIIGSVLLLSFIVMQFFRIDRENPPIQPEKDLISSLQLHGADVELLKAACFDCHSYETSYPWYSNIAPVSWLLEDHIKHGRKHLNLSLWQNYSPKDKKKITEEAIEEIEEEEMPLKGYSLMHSKANLSNEDRLMLVNLFKRIAQIEQTQKNRTK